MSGQTLFYDKYLKLNHFTKNPKYDGEMADFRKHAGVGINVAKCHCFFAIFQSITLFPSHPQVFVLARCF